MIKQIQLRGISRTPSDRLSDDGGLSESLNMIMDTAESAPVLLPEDVTSDLGLPENLQADRVFIHKTANYENTIVVQKDRIVAYTPQIEDVEPLLVMDLTDGEKVNDITSIGNTLIISTTANLYYILYNDREYSLLGNKVPFPYINFDKINIQPSEDIKVYVEGGHLDLIYRGDFWFLKSDDVLPPESVWNADSNEKKDHSNTSIQKVLKAFWDKIDNLQLKSSQEGHLYSSVLFRYEIEMLGAKWSSMPVLVCSRENGIQISISTKKDAVILGDAPQESEEKSAETDETITCSGFDTYDIIAKLESNYNIEAWKDLSPIIRIYMSKPIRWNVLRNSSILSNRETSFIEEVIIDTAYAYHVIKHYTSSAKISFNTDPTFIDELLQSSLHKIEEIPVFNENATSLTEEFKKLQQGYLLDLKKYLNQTEEDYVQLETQDILSGDDMKHYLQMSKKLDVFNNQLLLVQPSQIIDYDYSRLNSYDKVSIENAEASSWYIYDVTYLLKGVTEDKVVKKRFEYYKLRYSEENIYAFQIFPDSRAYKMLVKVEIVQGSNNTYKYGEFDMQPHPYLDCAYYYGGIENKLIDLCTKETIAEHPVNTIDDLENKLIVSEQDNPFFFPLEHRYTFQSKILGVAVATTALSQGQFGQFPLYVFTEDGVWAMETADDGSFVSQKPLSREVCINPDSITSIDNAVVFVTAKGVMMVQGSEVVNISPYMNGKHYVPNDSARKIIANQEEFNELIGPITDKDPFTSFMRDAKTAYDYAGQRIIFFSPTNRNYQYIYKIDTQTWHKMSIHGLKLDEPLNSYPECLVRGDTIIGTSIPNAVLKPLVDATRMTPDQVMTAIKDKTLFTTLESVVAECESMDLEVEVVETTYDKETTIGINGIKQQPGIVAYREIQRILQLDNTRMENVFAGTDTSDVTFVLYADAPFDEMAVIAEFIDFTIKSETIINTYVTFFVVEYTGGGGSPIYTSKVFSLSTVFDYTKNQVSVPGILITRPFDLGMPDVYKSITSIKIRGDYDKGNVKYILQGSDNGREFYTLGSLRGKSWKMFRLFILADLEPTERISWIDVDFEPRYNTKLR